MSEAAPAKANLFQSMALGGMAASFAVNFTHPIVREMLYLLIDRCLRRCCCLYICIHICTLRGGCVVAVGGGAMPVGLEKQSTTTAVSRWKGTKYVPSRKEHRTPVGGCMFYTRTHTAPRLLSYLHHFRFVLATIYTPAHAHALISV
jgi:hypothetical protein